MSPMEENPRTMDKPVLELIRDRYDALTRTERRLADALLDNYPVAGLTSMTRLAESAGVSTPSVLRMAQKLGFSGFPDLQASLRAELEATISNPIAKHDSWSEHAPNTHILNRFADAVMQNMRETLGALDPQEFDAVRTRLADRRRSLLIAGGRITHALAQYMFTHMQVIRENVTLLPPNANTWPHFVLNISEGDVLVVFDIRRYENDTLKLAEMARSKGASIILFTDRWGSPVSRFAENRFNVQIEAPSAWDSSVVTLFIVEALIAAAETEIWGVTSQRMKQLEGLFDETRLFRKARD